MVQVIFLLDKVCVASGHQAPQNWEETQSLRSQRDLRGLGYLGPEGETEASVVLFPPDLSGLLPNGKGDHGGLQAEDGLLLWGGQVTYRSEPGAGGPGEGQRPDPGQGQGMVTVLVSRGYCNKVPKLGGLKTMAIYSFTVLMARSLKARCQQCRVSAESLGRILPCLFQFLEVAIDP